MKARPPHRLPAQGFTLIELMVGIAVVAVILGLAAPAFFDFMQVQRLKSINAQVVTDMMLARSEAVSRGSPLRVAFGQNTTSTCYTLYVAPTNTTVCDCLQGPGEACKDSTGVVPSNVAEVKTVVQPRTSGVTILTPAQTDPKLAFSATTGGILAIPTDNLAQPLPWFEVQTSLDSARTLKTTIGKTGRPTVCALTTGLGAATC